MNCRFGITEGQWNCGVTPLQLLDGDVFQSVQFPLVVEPARVQMIYQICQILHARRSLTNCRYYRHQKLYYLWVLLLYLSKLPQQLRS